MEVTAKSALRRLESLAAEAGASVTYFCKGEKSRRADLVEGSFCPRTKSIVISAGGLSSPSEIYTVEPGAFLTTLVFYLAHEVRHAQHIALGQYRSYYCQLIGDGYETENLQRTRATAVTRRTKVDDHHSFVVLELGGNRPAFPLVGLRAELDADRFATAFIRTAIDPLFIPCNRYPHEHVALWSRSVSYWIDRRRGFLDDLEKVIKSSDVPIDSLRLRMTMRVGAALEVATSRDKPDQRSVAVSISRSGQVVRENAESFLTSDERRRITAMRLNLSKLANRARIASLHGKQDRRPSFVHQAAGAIAKELAIFLNV